MATTTFKVVDFYRNNNANTNSLGFNVTGGYASEIPATIFNINSELHEKLLKLEEGDIILEINGINTRHLTLSEVLKQLRCCGNHVLLKLKSDPEYKLKFKELKDTKYKDLLTSSLTTSPTPSNSSQTTTPTKTYSPNSIPIITTTPTTTTTPTARINQQQNLFVNAITSSLQLKSDNVTYIRNASKSYDNYINDCSSSIDSNIENNVNSLIALPINDNYDPKKDNICLTPPTKQGQKTSLSLSPSSTSSASSTSSSTSSTSSSESPIITNDNFDVNLNSYQLNGALSPTTNDTISIDSTTTTVTSLHTVTTSIIPLNNSNTNNMINPFNIEIDEPTKRKIDEKLKDCNSESDTEINVYTPKAVDLPSAQRLAKRLYYLDGFKANDVVRHLSKKNDFSQLVADEYLKLFNFQGLTLDAALRKFLKQFQLVGDAQEKERVLMYFAKHYVDSNLTAFNNVDTCHTLTCAIMLLNTDLHDTKVQNKMTLNEFIENLKGLNDGGNFSDALLESLYNAIKNEPLECADIDVEDIPYEDRVGGLNSMNNNSSNGYQMRPLGCNPFLQLPDPHLAKEYKFGWLLRKCCIEADGKKAPFLKRSWKMFYASLRDMVLYLHKDDKGFKANTFDNISNAIRIHHAYASVATDYKKKQFVFRLKTADWAEYLFQTSNTTELNEWVNVINLVAAMFSSPPLASAVGSSKTFQRPLLPVSVTRYTLQEQYDYHKKHIKQIQLDLNKLETTKEEKSFDKDKYNYLVFEIQRYTTYLKLLEDKLNDELNNTALNNHLIQTNNNNNNNTSLISTNGNCYNNQNNNINNDILINQTNDIIKTLYSPSNTATSSTTSTTTTTTVTATTTTTTTNNHVLSTKKIFSNNYVN